MYYKTQVPILESILSSLTLLPPCHPIPTPLSPFALPYSCPPLPLLTSQPRQQQSANGKTAKFWGVFFCPLKHTPNALGGVFFVTILYYKTQVPILESILSSLTLLRHRIERIFASKNRQGRHVAHQSITAINILYTYKNANHPNRLSW
jgi:hypothetical protein